METPGAHDISMEAAVIFESYLPDALCRALDHAGDEGFVASMPQLLHARTTAPYDNEIWSIRSFASHSEENVVRTRHGNHVVVAVHGGGIFASPQRFRTLYHASTNRFSELGFTGLFGAKISEREAQGLLDGKLPDGNEVPVFRLENSRTGFRICRGDTRSCWTSKWRRPPTTAMQPSTCSRMTR